MSRRNVTSTFEIVSGGWRARQKANKHRAKVQARAEKDARVRDDFNPNEGFPVAQWGWGGDSRARSGWGTKIAHVPPVKVAAHTAATAFPYVTGPSLGANGVPLGRDVHGGGDFCFDPWEAYDLRFISGMSMVLFGHVGMGKSSLCKSMATRLVQAGRKLAVASDLKGEWTPIVLRLAGPDGVIQVGPGLGTCINPLDEGIRPSVDNRWEEMTDEKWAMVVRTRRISIMETLIKILNDVDKLSPEERAALSKGIDEGVAQAGREGRVPILSDVVGGLAWLQSEGSNAKELVAKAANVLEITLSELVEGGLAGMFNGESTATFSGDLPAVSIDTSAMRGAGQKARRMVSACCGSWIEAMVANPDGGQRLVVYEEGWDSISSLADLERMVDGWKLSRDYGIFNVLILHKVSDLQMAGDRDSRMAAMANSLLADADVKVIYRQDAAALQVTMDSLELTDRERDKVRTIGKGYGLWRVGTATFEVENVLAEAEIPLFDTDQRMDGHRGKHAAPVDETPVDADGFPIVPDEDGEALPAWLGA